MTAIRQPDVLDAQQLATYGDEGYLVVANVLTAAELAELVDRVDGLLAGRYPAVDMIAGTPSNKGARDVGRLIKQVMPMKFPVTDAVLRRMCEHPRLQRIAAQLLGVPAVTVFQQQALVKDPGQDNPTPWHQDDHYWKTGGQAVTAWFPLEPLFADSGTMSVVPRTHRSGVMPHAPAGGASAFQEIRGSFDEAQAVPLPIPLGSVSFHHSKLIHGAYGNHGKVRRVAMALRFRPV
jgi:ectoine hydroxylase-related dioxygenase (phytanoyl-CoA dioxygenase family)